jgi:hypothetical protein
MTDPCRRDQEADEGKGCQFRKDPKGERRPGNDLYTSGNPQQRWSNAEGSTSPDQLAECFALIDDAEPIQEEYKRQKNARRDE